MIPTIKKRCTLLMVSLLAALSSPLSHAFTKGADVSWITEMEASNYAFYNDSGNQQDLFQILKDHGMDAIRLRVWVDPDGGWNNIEDTIAKARRAKSAGMRIMIDFHYSDSWADPGKQYKPSAWNNLSFDDLMAAVWQHTHDSLSALKNAGINPEWVQVGNETNNGMLWSDGRASENMRNFTWLVNSGYNATKEIFPAAKVIVHISNCHDNGLFRWIFDGLNDNGGKWDVIGASNYPTNAEGMDWRTANSQCQSNLNDMANRYNTEVMVVEVGVPWDHSEGKAIVADVIDKVRQVPGGRGLGVFYWEPQGYNWKGYTLGAWNPDTQRPTTTLDAFLEGNTTSSSSSSSYSSSSSSTSSQSSTSGGTCNWYGTEFPLCVNLQSGWGWESNQSCISASTCSSQ